MVEPDRNGHPNLVQQVRKYLKSILPKSAEVYAQHIHRLDRPVSGVILFARQKDVLKNLSEQFAERKVKKYYQALTLQPPPKICGQLENWHYKEKKKAVIINEPNANAEKVILNYSVQKWIDRWLWNIELHTGKYHQIRAQLAAAGCPIIGDVLYNSTAPYKQDSIALHAYKLIFSHPITGETITVEKQNNFFSDINA